MLRAAADGTIVYANAAAGPLLRFLGCRLHGALPAPWRGMTAAVLDSAEQREIDFQHNGRIISFTVVPVCSEVG